MQGPKSKNECPQKRAAAELGDTEGSVTTGRDCMMSYRPRTTEECRQFLEARRGVQSSSSFTASRKNEPCRHLEFVLPAPRTVGESVATVSGRSVCGTCFQQP